ncbi:uncharacterized protein LOC124128992 isoform X2 [Haliotis rufescens]|uniref:uncharacterized protein LOC124128992 isoform X2 n=1 Tax=Haliotis rufescens TaxID=6454 RepID=UPI00201F701E|nr:uncharacterized protein LOC124128992 isoform X2 [Haliotis rufescens]
MERTPKRAMKRHLEEKTVDSGHGTDDEGPTADPALHYIRYDSTSTFPPTVMERGNSLEEIIKSVPSQGIFPSEMLEAFKAEDKHTNLTLRLKEFTRKAGITLVGRALAATCNLKNCNARPDTIICDALLMSKSLPPTLLTFIEDKEDTEAVVASVAAASKDEGIDDYGKERKYNKSVAKAMMYARYFTDEPFDVIYGVIKSEDTKTTKTFNRRLSNIKEETSKYSIGSNLLMSQERCLKIHKAFIMMSALSDIRLLPAVDEDVGKASHYVVPVDMYRKLMFHLHSTHHRTTVSHSESFQLLLDERLSKTGQRMEDTLLSDTSMAQVKQPLVKLKGAYRKSQKWVCPRKEVGHMELKHRETMTRSTIPGLHRSGKRLRSASRGAFLPL